MSTAGESESGWDKLTVDQLKAALAQLELSSDGTKQQLVERLLEHDKEADAGKVLPLRDGEQYHVFIAHSRMQSEFVEGSLRKTLQEDYRIKCCDVDEDYRPGLSVVINTVDCIKKSRKVILLVSKDFMKSNWTNFEIGEAIQKEGKTQKATIIPILWNDVSIEDLPTYLRRQNILKWDGDTKPFWRKLIDAIADETVRDTDDVGNVADGLAWSYYYGFLKLVLPGLIERAKHRELFDFPKEPKKYKTCEDIKHLEMLPKMMIIMPKSGFCPPNLTDDDENVQFVCHIPHKAHRAGNINRDYKSSIYSVKGTSDNITKEVLVIAEFATPLMSMHEMELGKLANFSEPERLQQKMKFEEKIQEILEVDKECQGSFCFLQLEDKRNQDKKPIGWSLSHTMSERAFKELNIIKKAREAREVMISAEKGNMNADDKVK